LSRVVLTHATRQAGAWLIFDVRQKIMRLRQLPVVVLGCLAVLLGYSGCESHYRNSRSFLDQRIFREGIVFVYFEKLSDGRYIVEASGQPGNTDEQVLASWKSMADFVANGRPYAGTPEIGEYQYRQGFTLLLPHETGQLKKGRKAAGTIEFKP
jgi:hypothetical protein